MASVQLPSAAAVLAWLATYLVHSTLWFAGAWIVARWIREPRWRERLWKGALAGGFASAGGSAVCRERSGVRRGGHDAGVQRGAAVAAGRRVVGDPGPADRRRRAGGGGDSAGGWRRAGDQR